MKKKACVKCKMFVESNECPGCKGMQFTTNWKGRLFVIDTEKSIIANKGGFEQKGEYAIKI